jgi:glycosyltransferase involved in cell wall biosynthesis
MMLGTFGFRPKGTMSARALGIAEALAELGTEVRIATVPWDNPTDAGRRTRHRLVDCINTRSASLSRWPLAVGELVIETRRFQPDIIHLFKPKGFGDLAARVLSRMGHRVVVDMDDWEGTGGWNDVLPYSRLQRALFDWQERTWPAAAGAVTAASRTLVQRAENLGASQDRVFYLPNGLSSRRIGELTEFADAERNVEGQSHAFAGRPVILLYTRFTEFAPEFAVEILDRVDDEMPDCQLFIAGGSADGSSEERLTTAARRAGLADQIVQIGWIAPDSLGRIASRCDVALVPFDDSVINRAKCSVKLLELMATGIPIVASAVGENREYLQGGRLGRLARVGDAADHANGILGLLRSPAAVQARSNTAQRTVQDRYCWARLLETVLEAYRVAIRE